MENEGEETTSLIPKKVKFEQGKTRLYIALTFTNLSLWLEQGFFSNEKYDFFY